MIKKKILIVEDERIIAEDIKRTLGNFGYEVAGIVSAGNDAISIANETKPDLVLMDIMLEGSMTGIQAAAQIRNDIGAPVIYLTAYANEKTLQSAKITEPFGYIIKPFEERELHATIEMAFYRHKIEKAIQLKTSQQEQLLESARHLTSSLDLKEVLEQIGSGAKKIMKAHSCAIYLLDDSDTLKPVIAIDPKYEQEIMQTTIKIETSYTGMAVQEKRALIFNNAYEDAHGINIPGTSHPTNERVIVAPFIVDDKVLGAMCLSRLGEYYTDEDLTLADAYATYASTALKNAQTHQDLQNEIEERKLAEKRLRETQFRLATIFKNVPNIILYEKFGGRDFISDNAYDLLGIKPDDYASGKIKTEDLIEPNEREVVQKKFQEWFDSGSTELLSLWYKLKKPDGSLIWIEDRMFPITTENGEKYISGVMIDMTTLKKAEEALRKSQLMYKAVVEDQSELIIRYQADGNLTFINEAYCRNYNCSYQELLNTNWFETLSETERQIMLDKISQLSIENPTVTYVLQEELPDGTQNWIEWTSRAIFNGDNKIIEYQAVGRNITEKKLGEKEKESIMQQLIQSQKMEVVGRLAGGIAHDFNNLLTAINGYADLILKKLSEHDPVRKDIDIIINCGNRASDLTKQLLAFSRKQIVEPQVINLNDIIVDMDKMLRRLIGEDLEFITSPGVNLHNVKADKSQIEQVITNLVLNARDAISNGGKILVTTRNVDLKETIDSIDGKIIPNQYILMSVQDDGIGMNDEIMSHLFEPFFTTKEQGKGTGLGLATVFGIIKQNKGYITVTSSPGEGSKFSIYFPVCHESISIDTRKQEEIELPTGDETILLTEDEPNIREFVFDILKEYGYKVLDAGNGKEAIIKAKSYTENIDLLITDVIMPNMNGNLLAENIKKIYPDIKVLFMSGYTESTAIQKGILELKTSYLQKPFSSSDLIIKVRQVLDKK